VDWESYLPDLVPVIAAAIVVAGSILLAQWVVARMRTRAAMPYQVRGARLIITTIGLGVAALILFFTFGSISAVSGLTVSAILTLAATLALQTTIGNVIAGFILLRNRFLRLNDEVTVSGISGKVVQLGLVTTWLRRDDGTVVSVSNSTLLGGPLVNKSASERLKGEY
jgi:small-conductance mechanosensitive channel